MRRPSWKPGAIALMFGLSLVTSLPLTACTGARASQQDQLTPIGPCGATWSQVPDEGHAHVSPDTELSPGSNPPASGNHFPTWATWGVHEQPLPRGYYIHNLEHGGVVLLYRCDGECPAVVAQLEEVALALDPDPACAPPVRQRVVITPDPLLDTPVAAAAWDHVYRADCVDRKTLTAFIEANYDHAPESFCSQGEIE